MQDPVSEQAAMRVNSSAPPCGPLHSADAPHPPVPSSHAQQGT
jgi:hypothetical protein